MIKKNNFLKIFWICFFLVSMFTECLFPVYAQEYKAQNDKIQANKLSGIESGKVVLSWKEFKLLLDEIDSLKQMIEDEKEKKEQKKIVPPVDYSITSADYNGSVEKSYVRLAADFSVNVLKDGWVVIPFFPGNIGIESFTIRTSEPAPSPQNTDPDSTKDEPAAHFDRSENGYRLIARGPGKVTISANISIPVQVEDISHTFSFTPPDSVINRMELRFSDRGVNIIHAEPEGRIQQKEDETVFTAVLAQGNAVRLNWKIEKDTGIQRKSAAVLHTLASISKSAITMNSRILLKYLAAFDAIEFRVPADVEILNVTSPRIETWTTKTVGEYQVVRLSGNTEPHSETAVVMMYRLKITSLPLQVRIPVVQISGVEDGVEGFLGIEISDNLEVITDQVEKGDLVPPKNLPRQIWQSASNPILYGYHFYSDQFQAAVGIKSYQELETVIANVDFVDCVTHRTLEGKSITRLRYFIRNNDRQFLTLALPENSRIWQAFLDGRPVKPARKESGEILIPMKKSSDQGEKLESFSIEVGYITDVERLSLKGDILNKLPKIDIPISYLQWKLYIPEYYEYAGFEGPLKQVGQFTGKTTHRTNKKFQIEIPTQGKEFLFEKYLIVDEMPYVRGKYGQHLGDRIFLTVQPYPSQHMPYQPVDKARRSKVRSEEQQLQVTPNYQSK